MGLCNTWHRVIDKCCYSYIPCFIIPAICPYFGGLETKPLAYFSLPVSSTVPSGELGSFMAPYLWCCSCPINQLTQKSHENSGVWTEVSLGIYIDCTLEKLVPKCDRVKWHYCRSWRSIQTRISRQVSNIVYSKPGISCPINMGPQRSPKTLTEWGLWAYPKQELRGHLTQLLFSWVPKCLSPWSRAPRARILSPWAPEPLPPFRFLRKVSAHS